MIERLENKILQMFTLGVSPQSKDADKTTNNNNTIETRRVVNSIKDIIKSPHHR